MDFLWFLFGVVFGLAMMYAICDVALAAPDRKELHRLLGWRWPSRSVPPAVRGNDEDHARQGAATTSPGKR